MRGYDLTFIPTKLHTDVITHLTRSAAGIGLFVESVKVQPPLLINCGER